MTGLMSGSDGRTKELVLLVPAPLTAVMSNNVPHRTSDTFRLTDRKGFVVLMLDMLLLKLAV